LLEKTSSYGARVTTDNFNRASLGSGWSCRKGTDNWEIMSGSYLEGSDSAYDSVVLNNEVGKVTSSVTLQAKIMPRTGGDMICAQFVFGYENTGHYFVAGMQSSGTTRYWIIKEVGGDGECFYTQTSDAADTWYTLKVQVSSELVGMWKWSGGQWVMVQSAEFNGPVPQGNVGFCVFDSIGQFDDFQANYNGYTWTTSNRFTLGPGAVREIISKGF
jgi:hypothetical protein